MTMYQHLDASTNYPERTKGLKGAAFGMPLSEGNIRKARGYVASLLDADTDIATPKTFRLVTPAASATPTANYKVFLRNIRVTAGASGVTIEVLEAPTVNAAGTAVARICKDRITASTAQCTAFEDTTTTADGTIVYNGRIPAAGGEHVFGGMVLKQGVSYIVRVTAIADNTVASASIEWDEEPDA